MKLIIEEKQTTFVPVKFSLLIETQEELDKLHNLFNQCSLLDYLKCKNSSEIRSHLEELGANQDNNHWDELCRLFKV